MHLTVVGRGTAGCLTALYMRKEYPEYDVTMVYDDKIPIIGVGESTTPMFMNIMEHLDISIEDLIKNCDATVKNSIKFTNWNGDGKHYYHGFAYDYDPRTAVHELYKGGSLDSVDYSAYLSDNGKYSDKVTYATHFNAKNLAEYLERVAVERNVHIENGRVEKVNKDSTDFVEELVLDSGKTLKTDFVFDCTGFARLFVKQTYDSPYKSYAKHLPVKRAMPFFLERKEEVVPTYTESIAMKYGWMWKIPVGNRYGCGYVYDSDYVSDDQAYEEICEVTGQRPYVPRKLSFSAGYYTKPFNKNTVALGLSHGFLEPLEATAIWLVLVMLVRIPKLSKSRKYTKHITRFNATIETCIDKIVSFIYMHYMSNRNDTAFWREFTTKNEMPEYLKSVMNILSVRMLEDSDVDCDDTDLYEAPSWVKCASGVNCIPRQTVENEFVPASLLLVKKAKKDYKKKCDKCIDHTTFISKAKTST